MRHTASGSRPTVFMLKHARRPMCAACPGLPTKIVRRILCKLLVSLHTTFLNARDQGVVTPCMQTSTALLNCLHHVCCSMVLLCPPASCNGLERMVEPGACPRGQQHVRAPACSAYGRGARPKRRSGDQRLSHVTMGSRTWPKNGLTARVWKTWLILPVVIRLSQSRS